jgi:O-antigen ligase
VLNVFTNGRGALDALRFLSAFAVVAAYWPGISGAGTSPRWGLLAFVAAPALFVGPRLRVTALHLIGAAFVTWALLTLTWSTAILDGIDAALKLAILACVFCLGGECDDLRPLYRGAALGMGVSSCLAVLQVFAHVQFADLPPDFAVGLFVNRLILAEAAALIAVALLASRLWLWLPLVLPALILPLERGPVLAFSVAGAVSLWCSSRLAAAVLVMAGTVFVGAVSLGVAPTQTAGQGVDRATSAMQRPAMWQSTAGAIDLKGHGLGSFRAAAPQPLDGLRLDHAHNEVLEAAFETGIVGAMLFAVFWASALWAAPRSAEAAVLIALLLEACLAFPLHEPVTGALGLLCAGRCARDLPRAVDAFAACGIFLRRWLASCGRLLARDGRADSSRRPVPIRSSLS